MRWDRVADSFMEVWYASITDPRTGWGFWIRYTITAPQRNLGEPYCELWAFAFDPSAANSGVADIALQLYRREGSAWSLQRALTATRSSHLEFGRREAWPEPNPVFV